MAYELGKVLAEADIKLCYGGAKVGLMGAVANGALDNGGRVVGVLPKFLADKEIAHTQLTELILCDSMHERKKKMFELSEGFIALPGGFGTLEEVTEILTWQQLGLHSFPVGFLNISGYYNDLLSFFAHMTSRQLLKPENHAMVLASPNVTDLLHDMQNYKAPSVQKWIKKTMV